MTMISGMMILSLSVTEITMMMMMMISLMLKMIVFVLYRIISQIFKFPLKAALKYHQEMAHQVSMISTTLEYLIGEHARLKVSSF